MSLFPAPAPADYGVGQPDEAELVRRARRADGAAWEAIAHGHMEPVFRLAYLILGDAADAEDVAQETFIRAYTALERFDETRPLRPWLLSIAANLARNRRRGLGRYWAALPRAFRENPATGQRVEIVATPTKKVGQFVAEVTFPSEGAWTLSLIHI